MSNIPIYRAKKIDSDEYAYGFCFYDEVRKEMFISNDAKNLYTNRFRVDTTTLSIHFPDMLAKNSNRYLPNGEKDLRIFASLQDDGKGGDKLNCWISDYEYKTGGKPTRVNQVLKYYKPFYIGFRSYDIDAYSALKIIGIQE